MSALRPAALDEYLTWLRAWLEAGNQPTHAYDYPWSRQAWFTATSDFRLGGECGADAVQILVQPGIEHAGGELGHNKLYLMDGPEQRGEFVPVFADPVFELLPGVREFVRSEARERAEWMRERAEAEEQRQLMAEDSDVPRSAR